MSFLWVNHVKMSFLMKIRYQCLYQDNTFIEAKKQNFTCSFSYSVVFVQNQQLCCQLAFQAFQRADRI